MIYFFIKLKKTTLRIFGKTKSKKKIEKYKKYIENINNNFFKYIFNIRPKFYLNKTFYIQ